MNSGEAALEYNITRHALYDLRSNGGSGSTEEGRLKSKLYRLRKNLKPDGKESGVEVTMHIDSQVVTERAKAKVLRRDFAELRQ